MAINLKISTVYDGNLLSVITKKVVCVPRVGDYIITQHGRQPVHSVTHDYSGKDDAVEIVVVIDDQ